MSYAVQVTTLNFGKYDNHLIVSDKLSSLEIRSLNQFMKLLLCSFNNHLSLIQRYFSLITLFQVDK